MPCPRSPLGLPVLAAAYAVLALHACHPVDPDMRPPDAMPDAGPPDAHAQPSDAASAPDRRPWALPDLTLTADDRARFQPLRVRPDGIPVLLFHQICPAACPSDATYGASQREFARMMLMLGAAGYTPIDSIAFAQFLGGQASNLPARPVLITFDDGRLDAYQGADRVLAALGFVATTFIITNAPEVGEPSFLSWSEIAAASASGRWDVQLHSHHGHHQVAAGVSDGGLVTAPFYAALEYDTAFPGPSHLETFASWQARSESDIARGQALLTTHLGRAPVAFAVPFSNYGQSQSNDARIRPELERYLDAHYAAWFTQTEDPDFDTPAVGHHAMRFAITQGRSDNAEQVYAWLARHAAQ